MLQTIVAIVTILSSVATIAGIIALLRHKTEALEKSVEKDETTTKESLAKLETTLRDELDTIRGTVERLGRDLQQALTLIRVSSGEQGIINKMMTDTLGSLNNKCTEIERQVNGHTTKLALLEQRKHNDG